MTGIITVLHLLVCLYAGNPAVPATLVVNNLPVTASVTGTALSDNTTQSGITVPEATTQAGITLPEFTTQSGIILPEATTQAGITNTNSVTESTTAGNITTVNTETATSAAILTDPSKLDCRKELTKLGFYEEDSKDGKLNLRNAILHFQSSNNMTVTGNWDDQCLKVLAGILAYGNKYGQDVIDSPPAEGMWITINKTKRILTLYEGSNILKKYPVAIGNPPSLTPEGKFTIVNKVINPYWGGGGYAKPVKGGIPANPLGYRWLGLSYKSGGDLGVHGNNSPYSIGKNISHGCIRMINSDVEELFEVVPKTTKVWIGTDAVLQKWGIVQKE